MSLVLYLSVEIIKDFFVNKQFKKLLNNFEQEAQKSIIFILTMY